MFKLLNITVVINNKNNANNNEKATAILTDDNIELFSVSVDIICYLFFFPFVSFYAHYE